MGCITPKNAGASLAQNKNIYGIDPQILNIDYQIATCKNDINNHYILDNNILGTGAYGHVKLATCKMTKKKLAIKVIKK